jgi:hypothetical protein
MNDLLLIRWLLADPLCVAHEAKGFADAAHASRVAAVPNPDRRVKPAERLKPVPAFARVSAGQAGVGDAIDIFGVQRA